MSGVATNAGQINFAAWLINLVAWDGVLPVVLFFVPSLIDLVIPEDFTGLVIVGVLIVAFFFRIAAGCRYIDVNCCPAWLQRIQAWSLVVGALMLLFIDAFLAASHELPMGNLFATRGDRIIAAVIGSIYLSAMAIALFPGRSKPLPDVLQL